MLEDSVPYVSRVLARLISIPLMSLPLPFFFAEFQELDLHLKKIAMIVPSVFVNIARLLLVRVAELVSTRCNCVLYCFLPKYWQSVLSCSRNGWKCWNLKCFSQNTNPNQHGAFLKRDASRDFYIQ